MNNEKHQKKVQRESTEEFCKRLGDRLQNELTFSTLWNHVEAITQLSRGGTAPKINLRIEVARDTWRPFSIPAQCLIDQG